MAVSDLVLATGLLLFTGFVLGRFAVKAGLPRITGYIFAGLLLNPHLWPVLPQNFDLITSPVTDICLAFITFEIGAELEWDRIKKAGPKVLALTVGESLGAWLAVLAGLLLAGWAGLAFDGVPAALLPPFALMVAALAAPTDPTATLAVKHEYRARGPVSETITEVAAFDDLMGILLFSIGMHAASAWTGGDFEGLWAVVREPARSISGALAVGVVAGAAFTFFSRAVEARAEGGYIVLLLAVLALAFGVARVWQLDSVLATMTAGVVVGNFHPHRRLLMQIIGRYTEELVFVFFFTLGSTHLDPWLALQMIGLAVGYAALRALGKMGGFGLVGRVLRLPPKVGRLAPLGLIPQGGIVIGLALSVQQSGRFPQFADVLLAVVMAATLIHEFVGPILARTALRRAGETRESHA